MLTSAWARVLWRELTVEHMTWVLLLTMFGGGLFCFGLVAMPLLCLAGVWPLLVVFGLAWESMQAPWAFLAHLREQVDMEVEPAAGHRATSEAPYSGYGLPDEPLEEDGPADPDESGDFWW